MCPTPAQGINTPQGFQDFPSGKNYGLIPPTAELSLGLKLKGEREGPAERSWREQEVTPESPWVTQPCPAPAAAALFHI